MATCFQCQKKDDLYTFEKCSHSCCKACSKSLLTKVKYNFSRCFVDKCASEIFDFEVRKLLDCADYKKLVEELTANIGIPRPRVNWICDTCTFLNLPYMKFCTTCQSNCPENYNPPDYYKPTKEEDDALQEEKRITEKELARVKNEEKEKRVRLDSLKQLSKQEVTMTSEVSECPVCGMEYGIGKAIILHSCLHTICEDCLKNYLLYITHPKVKCPTENCIGLIEDREIKKMTSDADYEKYQQLSLRTAEATETHSFHCKAVNCTAWIVCDEYLDQFACPLCKKVNCIKCKTIHEGMSCLDFKHKTSNEVETSDSKYFANLLKNGEAMICSGCKCLVEKDKGCDWIRCKLCQTELCWATKGPRWGPRGNGDTSGGCRCKVNNVKCHPSCRYCH